ncbi:MAG: hypothetical protein NUV54_02530 [Candidatus Taylorbacteria bacterium]|nr:hypothetical protein [Candidatus Taylorbacteria bacterium]
MKSVPSVFWSARLSSCHTISEVRRLLADHRVEHGSNLHQVIMARWRRFCGMKILQMDIDEIRSPEAWRELYYACPSGSPEEAVALGVWQLHSSGHDFASYRNRIVAKARRTARKLYSALYR